ncbi:MAG: type IV pilin [Candidatus Heimdallarchaeota archaeon]|nr:type IV pilin [Candidatus Heimdallarchaeota archaeon]MCK5048007.1 type IV pilin [Candidatus Heimdallarchaeota archaeon]
MNLIKLYRRRKAVSPVIAVVLLIALTVAAAGIIYFIVTDLLQPTPSLDFVDVYKDDTDGIIIRYKANQGDITIEEVSLTLVGGAAVAEDDTWWGLGNTIPTVDEAAATESVTDGNTVYVAVTVDGGIPAGTYTVEITYDAGGSTLYTSKEITVV